MNEELLWPFLLYSVLVLGLVGAILLASHFLGERHRAPGRDIPYESGITPTASARLRYGLHFYTVGIFFILFDVEAIFLYAWAVAFRELGWAGYISASLFIVVLFLGLLYVWRVGGLDWSPSRRRQAPAAERGESRRVKGENAASSIPLSKPGEGMSEGQG